MFKFTVRDLLWLTLVVAMGLGWSLREWKARQDTKYRRAFDGVVRALEDQGWNASVDFESSVVRLIGNRVTVEEYIGFDPFHHQRSIIQE
jgi:hypothetical protein